MDELGVCLESFGKRQAVTVLGQEAGRGEVVFLVLLVSFCYLANIPDIAPIPACSLLIEQSGVWRVDNIN